MPASPRSRRARAGLLPSLPPGLRRAGTAALLALTLLLPTSRARLIRIKDPVTEELSRRLESHIEAGFERSRRAQVPPGRQASAELEVPELRSKDTVPVPEVQLGQVQDLRLLGHAHLPLKVLMVLTDSTLDEVQAMLDVIRRVRADGTQPGADELRLHLITAHPGLVRKLDVTPQELRGVVEVNRWFSTTDIWLQDWGEVAAARLAGAEKHRMLVLDTNRGRGLAPLPGKLARLWSSSYLKLPVSQSAGNYGGNIEVLPDDTLAVGDSADPELRDFLGDLGYRDRLVTLESAWLKVGHVDEYLTYLPAPEAPLGFVIAKADPQAAMELLRRMDPQAFASQLAAAAANATRYAWRNPRMLRGDEGEIQDALQAVGGLHLALAGGRRGSAAREGRSLLEINQAVAEVVDRNVARLQAALRRRHGATPLVVSVPTLWRGASGDRITLLPDSVNMIVLGRHLAVPDPLLPAFREFLQAELGRWGLTTHLVPNWTYHRSEGQLHCGTAVFRHPTRRLDSDPGQAPGAPAPWTNRRARRFRVLHGGGLPE